MLASLICHEKNPAMLDSGEGSSVDEMRNKMVEELVGSPLSTLTEL